MRGDNIKQRTKALALQVLQMTNELPKIYSSQVIGRQVVRSATSVGANYRAACRSRSNRDFVYKMKIVEEELDETNYWLELLGESHAYCFDKIVYLQQETTELLKIIVSSIKTTRRNHMK
ncbi:MAG: four helix bundle protein [Bacteroidia bacterium]|nr:four helix bundle protein [Bacteroidia bacterium]